MSRHTAIPASPADSIRAALHHVFQSREYTWTQRADPFRWLRENFLRFADWLDSLRHTHPVAYLLILLGLVAAFALIAVHLSSVVRRAMRAAVERAGLAPAGLVGRDMAWHLARARELVAAGQYREALAERFVALALELDQRGVVRFHPSKTPGEYAGEARLPDDARGSFRALVRELYGYLFGGVACSPERWAEFDAAAVKIGGAHAAS